MSLRRGLLYAGRHTGRRSFLNLANVPSPWNPLPSLAEDIIEAKNAQTIHKTYPRLLETFRNSKATSSPLNIAQWTAALRLLATSARPGDIVRMKDMLQNMQDDFNLRPGLETHTAIIRAFAQAGHIDSLVEWLNAMPSLPGAIRPSLDQFHAALNDLRDLAAPLSSLRRVIAAMSFSGCKPTAETFLILIQARWDEAGRTGVILEIDMLETLVADMAAKKIPYDDEVARALGEGYDEAGNRQLAARIRRTYLQESPSQPDDPQAAKQLEWEAAIAHASHTKGFQGALKTFQWFQTDGCRLTPQTIRALLQNSKKPEDLKTLESILNLKATEHDWLLILNNNLPVRDFERAWQVYQEAKTAGIIPSPSFVGRFIYHLCRPRTREGKRTFPTNGAVNAAFALYQDVIQAHPPESSHWRSNTAMPLYRNLMRALADCPQPQQFDGAAKFLRRDMKARNLAEDGPFTTSMIIFLMRTADNIDEAYEYYSEMRARLHPEGYRAVLNAFNALTVGPRFPPPELYMSIAKHMKDAGVPWTVETYTDYLRQICRIAPKIRDSDLRDQLRTAARQIHGFLKIDPILVPDTIFYNQLMNTYQHLGDFELSSAVWDAMYASGTYDNASISILFDAYSFAGHAKLLQSVLNSLLAENFPFSSKNWQTYVEALCRLDQLDSATKFVCLEMGQGQFPPPDVDVARTLLVFGGDVATVKAIMRRLHQFHPHLLKDETLIPKRNYGKDAREDLEKTRQLLIDSSSSNSTSNEQNS